MFEGLFGTTPSQPVKKTTGNMFEGLFAPKPENIKTGTIPSFLGGGAYNIDVNDPNRVVNTGHTTYGGVPTKKGFERADIVPVSLGGQNANKGNITYQDYPISENIKDAWKQLTGQDYIKHTKADKYLLEDVLPKYKAGQMTLGQARLAVLSFQQREDLEKEGIKQGVFANLRKSSREVEKKIFKDPKGLLEDLKKAAPATTEALKGIKETTWDDPMGVHMIDSSKKAVESVKDTYKGQYDRFNALFQPSQSKSETAAKYIMAGTGAINVLFAPVTALFEAAKGMPIAKTLVSAIELPLGVLSDTGGNITKEALSALPIDQKTKDNLMNAVGEVGSIAAMLLAGKLVEGTKPYNQLKERLKNRYGEKDANTILDSSKKKAKNTLEELKKEEPPVIPETPKPRTASDVVKENKLNEGIDAPINEKMTLGDLTVPKSAIEKSQANVNAGKGSKTKGAIEVFYDSDKNKFVVTDGNHRVVDILNKGGDASTPIDVKIVGAGYSDYFSTPSPKDTYVWKQPEVKPLTYNPVEQGDINYPNIKTSKLALGVEEKAIQKKLTDGFEGLPEYAMVDKAQQAQVASKLVRDNVKEAIMIAKGMKLPPEGVLPESVFVAVEQHALRNKDVPLLKELAQSNLTSEATGMGQRLSMLAERNPDSPVTGIKTLAKAREAEFERKTGQKVLEAKRKETAKMKEELKKSKPKADEWVQFLESIKCK